MSERAGNHHRSPDDAPDALGVHVRALRQALRDDTAEGTRLGSAARLRIRNRVRAGRDEASGGRLAPLFRPLRGLAYAGSFAVLALAALIGGRDAMAPAPRASSATVEDGHLVVRDSIRVSKENGQVVFEMAAAKVHRVRKMTRPDGTAVFEKVVDDGRFTDGLESDQQIVFYRID